MKFGDGTSVWSALPYLTATATAAGGTQYVQYNNAGAMGGDAQFTYNSTTNTLRISGAISSNAISGGQIKGVWVGQPIDSSYITGYIASANAVSRFADSSNIRFRFVASGTANEKFFPSSLGKSLYDWSSNALNVYGASSHTHDSRYYTETESLSLFAGSSNINRGLLDSISSNLDTRIDSLEGQDEFDHTLYSLSSNLYNRIWIDTFSGNVDSRIDALGGFDASDYITSTNAISRFADSANVRYRFVASSISLSRYNQYVGHSGNTSIHSFNAANYITSANAISRFSDSSNINRALLDSISSNIDTRVDSLFNWSSNALTLYGASSHTHGEFLSWSGATGYHSVSSNYLGHSSNRDIHYPSSQLLSWLNALYQESGTSATSDVAWSGAYQFYAVSSLNKTQYEQYTGFSSNKTLYAGSSQVASRFAPSALTDARLDSLFNYSSNARNLYADSSNIRFRFPASTSIYNRAWIDTFSGSIDTRIDALEGASEITWLSLATVSSAAINANNWFVESGVKLSTHENDTTIHFTLESIQDDFAGSSNVNRSLINTISSNLDTRIDSLFNFSSNKSLYPASSQVNRSLINSISSNIDVRIDSLFGWSSNAKNIYADSSNVRFRFPGSSNIYNKTWIDTFSGNIDSRIDAIEADTFDHTSYIVSSVAISRFADSANIQSKFTASSQVNRTLLNTISSNLDIRIDSLFNWSSNKGLYAPSALTNSRYLEYVGHSGNTSIHFTKSSLDDDYAGSSNVNRTLINSISSNLDSRIDSLFNFSSNKSLYLASSAFKRNNWNTASWDNSGLTWDNSLQVWKPTKSGAGVTNLSDLIINVDKDWNTKSIYNLISVSAQIYSGGSFYTKASAPTDDRQLANKKYVDDTVAAAGGYTDEMAQDAVGGMVGVGLTYDDATPLLYVNGYIASTNAIARFADSSNIRLRFPASSTAKGLYYPSALGKALMNFSSNKTLYAGSSQVSSRFAPSTLTKIRLDSIFNYSSNSKNLYANSGNVRYRFVASSISLSRYNQYTAFSSNLHYYYNSGDKLYKAYQSGQRVKDLFNHELYVQSGTKWTDLTDGGETTLHTHAGMTTDVAWSGAYQFYAVSSLNKSQYSEYTAFSGNKSLYANSANVRFRFPASTTAISRFADSSNIKLRFKPSSGIWAFASAQNISSNIITAYDVNMPSLALNQDSSLPNSLRDWFRLITSAGMISGGVIYSSQTEKGKFTISGGQGLSRISDNDFARLYFIGWQKSSQIYVATGSIKYCGVKYNSGNPVAFAQDTDTWDLDTTFPLGTVVNRSGQLCILNNPWWIGDGLTNVIERFDARGYITRDEKQGGLILGTSGDGNRYVTITSGKLWSRLNEFDISSFDTAGTDRFIGAYRDSIGGWKIENNKQQWPNTYYDNNSGTLQTVTNAQYANLWFYQLATGVVMMVYPQQVYNTAAQAEAGGPPSTIPICITEHGILIGRIIFKGSATTATSVQSAFTTKFSPTLVTDHGNLAGLTDDDHCFSEDTELLTKDGFIPYEEIEEGQEALTLNLYTNKLEYNKIQAKYIYDSFNKLIRYKNRYGEILVTPEHSMVYKNTCKPKKNPKSKYLVCTAKESLNKSVFNIPVNAISDGITYDKPLNFFKLLGLIISEGHFYNPKESGYGINIYQDYKNSKYIRDILDNLLIPYTERINDKNHCVFYIRSAWARENIRTWITEKRISDKLMNIRGEQFRALLAGLIYGDGSKRSTIDITKSDACDRLINNFDGKIRYSYHTGDTTLKDQLCHLCTLNNLRAYSYFRKLGWGRGCWSINITNKENILFGKKSKDIVDYNGNVWCVTVPNHTLVLRRNGLIFIAGNTQYHNDTRGDARYYTETELDAGQLDTRYYTESESRTNFYPSSLGKALMNFSANKSLYAGSSQVSSRFAPSALTDIRLDSLFNWSSNALTLYGASSHTHPTFGLWSGASEYYGFSSNAKSLYAHSTNINSRFLKSTSTFETNWGILTGHGSADSLHTHTVASAAPGGTFAANIGSDYTFGISGVKFVSSQFISGGTIIGTWAGDVITDAYIANDITLTNITQITNRSHTNLTDIGTNTHAQIDSKLDSIFNFSSNKNLYYPSSLGHFFTGSGEKLTTAYTHSQDNTQAHTDYLLNNADDSTIGTLTAKSFSGPLSGLRISAGTIKLTTISGIVKNISYSDLVDLTDGGETTLHTHAGMTTDVAWSGAYQFYAVSSLNKTQYTQYVGHSSNTFAHITESFSSNVHKAYLSGQRVYDRFDHTLYIASSTGISKFYDSESDLTSLLNDNYAGSSNVNWTKIAAISSGFDGRLDVLEDNEEFNHTLYKASSGIWTFVSSQKLSSNTILGNSITIGSVSNTEFGYLDGVTSAIQTQLDSKASISSYIASTVAISKFYPSTLGHYYTNSGAKLASAYKSASTGVFALTNHTHGIEDLSDVAEMTPEDGDALIWDNDNSYWSSQTVSTSDVAWSGAYQFYAVSSLTDTRLDSIFNYSSNAKVLYADSSNVRFRFVASSISLSRYNQYVGFSSNKSLYAPSTLTKTRYNEYVAHSGNTFKHISIAFSSNVYAAIKHSANAINLYYQSSLGHFFTGSGAKLATAYTHSQDNTQAHSDYLLNNADDATTGIITAKSFSGPISGLRISGGIIRFVTISGITRNISYDNLVDLTDGGETSLHTHAGMTTDVAWSGAYQFTAVSSMVKVLDDWYDVSSSKLSRAYISTSTGIFEPTLTKGTLTATSPIALSNSTRQLIGGASVISINNYIGSTQAIIRFADSSNYHTKFMASSLSHSSYLSANKVLDRFDHTLYIASSVGISKFYDSESDLTTLLNDNYAGSANVNWTKITAISSGFDGRLDNLEDNDVFVHTNYITSTNSIIRFYPSQQGHYFTNSGSKLNWIYQSLIASGNEIYAAYKHSANAKNLYADSGNVRFRFPASTTALSKYLASSAFKRNNWNSAYWHNSSITWDNSLSAWKPKKSGASISDVAWSGAYQFYAVSSLNKIQYTEYTNYSSNAMNLYYQSSLGHYYTNSGAILHSVYVSTSTGVFEPAITKGTLTATSPITLSDSTRQLIGGASVISISNYIGSTQAIERFADSSNYHTKFMLSSLSHSVYLSANRVMDLFNHNLYVASSTATGRFSDSSNVNIKTSGSLHKLWLWSANKSWYANSSNVRFRFPASSTAKGLYYPSSIGKATSGSLHNLWNWSSNKSWYANSANVRFRFQASALSYQSYKHSANSSIHLGGVSSPKSGQTVIYSADLTNATWQNVWPPVTYSVPNILVSSNYAIDIGRFTTPVGKSAYVLQANACNSGGASVGNLYIQMLSGNIIKFRTSSNILQQYSNISSANGKVRLRFGYSGLTALPAGKQYGMGMIQVLVR